MAIDLGWMGPNYSISTACATANYAFVAASNHIRKGDANIMIAGGSEAPIIPVGLGGFVACRCAGPSSPWQGLGCSIQHSGCMAWGAAITFVSSKHDAGPVGLLMVGRKQRSDTRILLWCECMASWGTLWPAGAGGPSIDLMMFGLALYSCSCIA